MTAHNVVTRRRRLLLFWLINRKRSSAMLGIGPGGRERKHAEKFVCLRGGSVD